MTPFVPIRRILATSIASLIGLAAFLPGASAQNAGMFSNSGALGTLDESANVGLSTSKTYLQAIDLGDLVNSTVNGVLFTGSGAATAPSGAGWALAGTGFLFAGGGTVPAGNLGALTNRFVYGGNPATFTLSGLTIGETYVLSFYNRSWESAGQRVQTITASGASTATTVFDQDVGAGGQGNLNILRYTFQATSATQTLSVTPQNPGNTMHFYAFTNELAFNNTWTGGANWSTATWSGAEPNGAGSNAAFTAQAAPATITLDADRTVGHAQFDGENSWTIAGVSTLTLRADVGGVSVLSARAGAHTISTPVVLANDAMKTGAGALTVSGAISGSRALSVNGGTLTLGATNSHTGGTRVEAGGTLILAAASALGSATAPLVVNAGGVLDVNGTSPEAGTLNGTGGTIANNASGTAATLTIGGNDGNGTFAGSIADHTTGTGTLGLTKIGAGTATVSGAASYSGPTAIVGGRLQLNGSAGAGTLATEQVTVASGAALGFTAGAGSTLTMAAGSLFSLDGGTLALDLGSAAASDKLAADTFAITANSALALSLIGSLDLGAPYTLVTYNSLSNPNAFTLSGFSAGRLTITPVIGANAITATAMLDSGVWDNPFGGTWSGGPWQNYTPTAPGDSALFGEVLAANSAIAVDSPRSVGFLTFDNSAASYTIGTAGSSNLTINNGATAGIITGSAGSHTIAENLILASDGVFSIGANSSLAVRGAISGARALVKSGPGTLTLTGANTYSAGTTVTGGTLELGDGILNGAVAGNITNDATLAFNNGAAQTYAGVISGTGAVTKTGPGTLTLTGASTFAGGLTISTGTVDIGGGTTTGSVAGTITNDAILRYSRTGVISIGNVVNGTGTTILAGGVSQNLTPGAAINTPNVTVGDTLQGYVFFGAPNQLNGTTGVLLNIAAHASNSRINLNGFDQTVAGLTGTGIVQNHENAAGTPPATFTINVPAGNSHSWSGLIRTQAGGALSLVKTGAGEQTMIFAVSNGAGSYAGPTTISEGRLIFGSTYAAPIWATSGINVAASAELGLTGAGAGVVSWGTNGRIISGAGSVARVGTDTNTVTITNANNSYTGPTRLSGTGTLAIGALANIGSNSSIGAGVATSDASNAASLVFDGGTLLYTGGAASSNRLLTLTQNGGAFVSSGTGAVNLSNPAPIAMSGTGPRVLTLGGANTGSNTLSAALGNGAGGASSVTKNGPGTWVLRGAATYTGSVAVNGGRLQFEGNAATSSTASGLAVNAGALFGFGAGAANTLALAGALTLNGGTLLLDLGSAAGSDRINAAVLTLTADSALEFNQIGSLEVGTPYTLASYAALINPGAFSVSGFQAGRLSLNPVVGANAITLTPVLDSAVWNSATGGNWSAGPWLNYTPNAVGDAALFGSALTAAGTIVVDAPQTAGYLTFDNSAASYTIGSLGSGNLTLANAGTAAAQITVNAGEHTIAEDISLGSDALVFTAAGARLNVSGSLLGFERSLTKSGGGTLSLSGANNFAITNGATLNINQGNVVLGSQLALGAGTAVRMSQGALNVNGHNVTLGSLGGIGGTITDHSASAGMTTLTVNQTDTTVFNGTINDGATRVLSVVKSGAGGLTLGGANTFSGGLNLIGGNVIAASGSGPAIPGNVTLGDNGTGGAIWLIAGAPAQQFGPDTVITWNNGGADAKFQLRGTSQTVAGLDSNITLSLSIIQNDEGGGATVAPGYTAPPGPATLTINAVSDHSFYGIIRNQQGGPLSFIKNGPGTQEFINNPNIGSFNYTGTTTINEGKLVLNLGGGTAAGYASDVTVNGQGTLALDGNWTLARPVTGSGDVVKQGFGSVTVSSALTHTGDTTIAGGTLVLTGSISGSANIDVQSGAILNVTSAAGGFTVGAAQALRGSGTIFGATVINGTLAPGDGVGLLTMEALTFGPGSSFGVEIDTSAITSDQAFVIGAFSLDTSLAPTLNLTDLGGNLALAEGTQFILVNYTGAWNGGLFQFGGQTIPDDGLLAFGANQYRLDYDAGGTSVALIVVPEPVAGVAFLAGLGFLAGVRRLRRR